MTGKSRVWVEVPSYKAMAISGYCRTKFYQKMQVQHDKLKRNMKALVLGEFYYYCITKIASGN